MEERIFRNMEIDKDLSWCPDEVLENLVEDLDKILRDKIIVGYDIGGLEFSPSDDFGNYVGGRLNKAELVELVEKFFQNKTIWNQVLKDENSALYYSFHPEKFNKNHPEGSIILVSADGGKTWFERTLIKMLKNGALLCVRESEEANIREIPVPYYELMNNHIPFKTTIWYRWKELPVVKSFLMKDLLKELHCDELKIIPENEK